MGVCLASCLYTCDCCISKCCYGCLMKGWCGKHDGPDGENMFNSPLGLVIYDKWCKEDEVYKFREQIFAEIAASTDDGRIETYDENKVDEDLVILDIGCGTGIYTEILCDKFLSNNKDTLLCMDISPQCLQFVRNRVVESNKKFNDKHIEYYCNDPNSLCLETQQKYNENAIDVVIMAFVMHHISAKNGDRDSILKELHKACKIGAIFVVFELGPDFMKEMEHNHGHKVHDERQPLKEESGAMEVFETCEDIQQYVEAFGFKFERKIMEDMFGNKQWILLFRKTADQQL